MNTRYDFRRLDMRGHAAGRLGGCAARQVARYLRWRAAGPQPGCHKDIEAPPGGRATAGVAASRQPSCLRPSAAGRRTGRFPGTNATFRCSEGEEQKQCLFMNTDVRNAGTFLKNWLWAQVRLSGAQSAEARWISLCPRLASRSPTKSAQHFREGKKGSFAPSAGVRGANVL